MNNSIKGKRANPKEGVNIRRHTGCRYKVLENMAWEIREEDKARWLALLSPPQNKWFEYNGTTTSKTSHDRQQGS